MREKYIFYLFLYIFYIPYSIHYLLFYTYIYHIINLSTLLKLLHIIYPNSYILPKLVHLIKNYILSEHTGITFMPNIFTGNISFIHSFLVSLSLSPPTHSCHLPPFLSLSFPTSLVLPLPHHFSDLSLTFNPAVDQPL